MGIQTNTLLAIAVAFGAIPAIEQQQLQADKGGIPNSHASSNAQGRGSGGGIKV